MRTSKSRLDELRDAEERNYQASVERLGHTLSLAEDMLAAYETIGNLLRNTKDPQDHLLVVSILFLAARYELERAALDTLRARLSDAYQATRRAAELAAFAAKIGRHPHLAEVWRAASEGGITYDKYREKFSKSLFSQEDALLCKLGERHDHGSKQFHGSPFSVATRTRIEQGLDTLELKFRTFDVDDDDPSEPAATLLWVLDTHFGILKVFVRVFEHQLGDQLIAWHVRENGIDAKMAQHRDRWRPAIEGKLQAIRRRDSDSKSR